MANTTNYNWETPDDTDLVKDGAAAIRTLGNSIDTTTKALNPETTLGDIAYRSATSNTNTRLPIGSNGQILGVSAGVPAWINNDQGDITEVQAGTGISVASGTGPIPVVTNTVATAIDAKGDLIVGTGADTFSRLAVGTNGHTLVADSSVSPTGLKWAAPAGGGKVLQVVSTELATTFSVANSTSFSDVTGLSLSITPSSVSSKILIIYNVALFNTVGTNLAFMRLQRGSTAISQGTASGSRTVATGGTDAFNGYAPFPAIAGNYLDSPATTSATTYKITIGSGTASGTLYVNRSSTDNDESNRPRFASVITAMEIGA